MNCICCCSNLFWFWCLLLVLALLQNVISFGIVDDIVFFHGVTNTHETFDWHTCTLLHKKPTCKRCPSRCTAVNVPRRCWACTCSKITYITSGQMDDNSYWNAMSITWVWPGKRWSNHSCIFNYFNWDICTTIRHYCIRKHIHSRRRCSKNTGVLVVPVANVWDDLVKY